MQEDLVSIIYASSANHLFTRTELLDLLKVSRENNEKADITGMLLYKDGNFIQAIEGHESVVNRLYQKIIKDPRHSNIVLLGNQPIPERQFLNWSMGFRNINDLSTKDLEGFSRFLEEDFAPDYFRNNPIRAYVMLLAFKENM